MNPRSRVPALIRVVLILAAWTEMGNCANYTVGVGFTNGNTNTSWTNTVNGLLRPAVLEAAYQQWAESVNVTVGDTLVFDYERGQHSVFLAKTLEAYTNCDFSLGSAETMSSDADLQTYTIKQTDGTLFFTCTVPGHCEGGQKVKITPFGTTIATSITPPTSSPSNAPQQQNLIFGMIITLFLMCYFSFFTQQLELS